MALTRRTLLSLPVAVPLLKLAARAAAGSEDYFPPPDAGGGWRTLNDPTEIRKHTGIDTSRLDAAFQYTQTTSQHGGLLVTRHGYRCLAVRLFIAEKWQVGQSPVGTAVRSIANCRQAIEYSSLPRSLNRQG